MNDALPTTAAPLRPQQYCCEPNCRTLTRDPSGRCPLHVRRPRPARAKTYRSNHGGEGDTPEQREYRLAAWRFYASKRWKYCRDYAIHREPFCRDCYARGLLTPAEEVDHIIPRGTVGGPSDWDADNLQALCRACHSAKTRREQQDQAVGVVRREQKPIDTAKDRQFCETRSPPLFISGASRIYARAPIRILSPPARTSGNWPCLAMTSRAWKRSSQIMPAH